MTTFADGLYQYGGQPVGSLGIGNAYYVIKTNEAYYNQFVQDRQGNYSDGSEIVYGATAASSHTAIQAALDACVEGRNDYVIVMPSDSDYDLTAVLTLSKKSVHLICQGGLGLERGATNACRLHQNTDATAIFAVSDSSIEIAGFYLKPYTDHSSITIAASSYGLNIHHNMFVLQWSSSPAEVILCAGDGGAWGQVAHHNAFYSQGGDDVTCASMITIGSSATGARCDYNDFFLGDGNVATVAVSNAATKGSVNYNDFMVAGSDGGYTHCIAIGSYGSAIGNHGCVGDGAIITGGVNDVTAVGNQNAVNGGAYDDLD
jgi:hypothetical protein